MTPFLLHLIHTDCLKAAQKNFVGALPVCSAPAMDVLRDPAAVIMDMVEAIMRPLSAQWN